MQELCARPDWDEVVALSRRDPDFETTATFIGVDLLDRAQAERKLAHLADVTHIFYCGLDGGIKAENVERNLALMVNPVEVVEPIAKGLERIVLSQGGKVYGRHLGRSRRRPRRPTRATCRPTSTTTRKISCAACRSASVDLVGAAAGGGARLRRRQPAQHPAGDRRLCCDLQGAGPAAALSRQARAPITR